MTPEQLRQARFAFRLTQAEIARLCGAARQTWQKWEAGERSKRNARGEIPTTIEIMIDLMQSPIVMRRLETLANQRDETYRKIASRLRT